MCIIKKSYVLLLMMVLGFCLNANSQFSDPFAVEAKLSQQDTNTILSVSFAIPDKHHLYTDKTSIQVPASVTMTAQNHPSSSEISDPMSGETTSFYTHDITFLYHLAGDIPTPLKVIVDYMGCDDSICFIPQQKTFQLIQPGITPALSKQQFDNNARTNHVAEQSDWRITADKFTITAEESGYMNVESFLAFLDGDKQDGTTNNANSNLVQKLKDKGIWLSLVIIVFLGLGLNLTPCVLPMIPINIAIIGAGSQSGSRGHGFALGATYGAGIALVYGALGLVVILTSSQFGALNSTPWFNIGIAILFLFLSLAMFGIFNIDFTHLQNAAGSSHSKRSSFFTAFFMGGIAALLAGACVAPVVIGVVVLSTELYQSGNVIALILPFVLGLGMALPWPFAGAGLSFLPKPGRWMERIKHGFGIIILGAALYYGFTAYRIITNKSQILSFNEMLVTAEKTGKPVLIDFWASWCKNCSKMEKTTFRDPLVEKKLSEFTLLKYQAEDMNNLKVKAIMEYYNVIGLPTYVVIERK